MVDGTLAEELASDVPPTRMQRVQGYLATMPGMLIMMAVGCLLASVGLSLVRAYGVALLLVALPLIVACPLLHLFLHRGHGKHDGHAGRHSLSDE